MEQVEEYEGDAASAADPVVGLAQGEISFVGGDVGTADLVARGDAAAKPTRSRQSRRSRRRAELDPMYESFAASGEPLNSRRRARVGRRA